MPDTRENIFGTYLKDRRTRLDPAAFGIAPGRRRTSGLRREEVAQRAHISPTWYTWLEQGRGGAPSSDVLERLSRALMLTDAEREHLFHLALGRPPEIRPTGDAGVTPRLQRVLDALNPSPALIKTPLWDVVAWNSAAAAVLTDYSKIPPGERNILRRMFTDPRVRAAQRDWESVARFVIDTFRADAARSGNPEKARALVDEMQAISPDFVRLWKTGDVRHFGEGLKHMQHPDHGEFKLEYSAFTVDGRPDLSMLVYNPATPQDARRIDALIKSKQKKR